MRNRLYLAPLLIYVLAMAACGSAATPNSSPTTAVQPTNTPTTGLTVYTSPDNKYQISYPTGWQEQTADGNPGKASFTGPNNQYLEVSDNAGTPGGDPAQLITDYCQAINPGGGQGPVTGTPVVLDGQTWLKAECDAEAPANTLIVEVVTYKGAVYQIDYSSPGARFQADDTAYYGPMEQSVKFLT